eukprot:9375566-Alexandrium_andersonii.AAC.1
MSGLEALSLSSAWRFDAGKVRRGRGGPHVCDDLVALAAPARGHPTSLSSARRSATSTTETRAHPARAPGARST